MSVLLASSGGGVQAVVADSANYDPMPRRVLDTPAIELAEGLAAPLLILHGTADLTVNVREPRAYETALRLLSKPYDVHYFDDAEHVLTRRSNPYYADAMARSIAFFEEHLSRSHS